MFVRLSCITFLVAAASCQQRAADQSVTRPARLSPPTSALQEATIQLTAATPGVHELTATAPSGATLRYTVSVPQGLSAQRPCPLVLALHYGGEVTPFYGRAMIDELVGPALAPLGAVVVAPDSLGGDWAAADNGAAVAALVRGALKAYPIDPRRVLVTGFSMGGHGTWSVGAMHPSLFTAAIPVAGDPGEGSVNWKLPVCVIHSKRDEVVSIAPARRRVAELKARGVEAQMKELAGPTHYSVPDYVPALREALPWLQKVWNQKGSSGK